jgi:hypothetical protein
LVRHEACAGQKAVHFGHVSTPEIQRQRRVSHTHVDSQNPVYKPAEPLYERLGMKGGMGLLGLVLALLVVAVLAKKQLTPAAQTSPTTAPLAAPQQPLQQQAQQVQQFQKALDDALATPRPEPKD